MINRYLNGDPLPWLTDGENPAVTYLSNKELLDEEDSDILYSSLVASPLHEYFNKNSSGNVLGNRKNPDLFYRGSVWYFLLAAESGFNRNTGFIRETADFICSRLQASDGGFSLDWSPSLSLGCRTGNLVSAMIRCGIKNDRTIAGVSWIVRNQRWDGGWLHCPFKGGKDVMKLVLLKKPGQGHLDDHDENVRSCPVATFACMSALLELSNPEHSGLIKKAAVFFLEKWFQGNKSIIKARCGLSVAPLSPGYPVMSQFDTISILRLIAGAGELENPAAGEMFNYIMKFQGNTGRWESKNKGQGMIQEKHGESRWVTLNALHIIRKILPEKDQLEKA